MRKLFGMAAALLSAAPAINAAPDDNWELREHANGELYWVYVPTDYNPDGAYPVVLRLHGCCWDGVVPVEPPPDPVATAFHGFNANTQAEPTFIVSPMSTGGWISKGDKVIRILEDVMAEFPIDPQRQILSGFSMGAAGAVDFLLAYRDRFAAAIVIAGPFGNAASINVAALAHTPVWLGIGTLDSGYSNNRTLVARWRAANGFAESHDPAPRGQYPRFSVFSRVGHGPAMEGLFGDASVVDWALQQRRTGNRPPWVRFDGPGYEAILNATGETITISGMAGDPDGPVAQVELWADGVPVLAEPGPGFSYNWPAELQTPGQHVFRVRVTDSGTPVAQINEDLLRVHVATPMQFPVDALEPATVGSFYRVALPAEGGADRATWTLMRDSLNALPPGLILRENGTLEGYPSATGNFPFGVQALDSTRLRNQHTFHLSVVAAPSTAPLPAELSPGPKNAKWGAWAVGEPFALSGYGDPPGAYAYGPHPYFDCIHETAGIEQAQLLRLDGLDLNSTAAELIRFRVHGRARVYVGYDSGPGGTVPAWLGARGFSDTGRQARVYLGNFRFFSRDYTNEVVSLGGNERSLHGGRKHYIVLVEPVEPVRLINLPGPVQMTDNTIGGVTDSWMGSTVTRMDWLPWFYSWERGWVYAASDGSGDDGGWYYSPDTNAYWWTRPDTFPHAYALPGGWIR